MCCTAIDCGNSEILTAALLLLHCSGTCSLPLPSLPPSLPSLHSDVTFTALFGIEASLKIFAWGFVPYIKDASNVLDFTIVVSAVLELLLYSQPWIKVFRALRALRPLRLLSHSEGMRKVGLPNPRLKPGTLCPKPKLPSCRACVRWYSTHPTLPCYSRLHLPLLLAPPPAAPSSSAPTTMKVFLAVFRAMFGMGAVTFVWVLFVFVFAVIGVQLFNGRFWYCADSAGVAVTSGYSATNSTIAIGNMVRACGFLLSA